MTKESILKLHIGCGKRMLPGYTHVDISEHEHVDVRCDIRKLDTYFKADADEIYACHVLEHFGRNEVVAVLTAWANALKPGGVIRIAVPDLEAAFEHYRENKNLLLITGLLYGGQRDEYDHHHIGFSFDTLVAALEQAGFEDVKKYDWNTFLPEGFDDYSRSYLPHLQFETGKLMSLNVVAMKKK